MVKIVCLNCGETFLGETSIPLLVKHENGDCELYDPVRDYGDSTDIFNGCPHCMTDAYLIDKEDGKEK